MIPIQPAQTQSLRQPAMDPRAQLQKAANMYEKHFLNEMVKAMRSSVQKGGLVKEGMADRIYTQQLDQEYVKSWVTRGGVGLSKLIEKQMLQQMGISMPSALPQRGDNGIFKIQQNTPPTEKKINMQIESSSKEGSLHLPWAGKLAGWFPSGKDSSGQMLVNHGEFESLWRLPKKPELSGQTDLAAGSLLLNTAPGVKVDLSIRKTSFS